MGTDVRFLNYESKSMDEKLNLQSEAFLLYLDLDCEFALWERVGLIYKGFWDSIFKLMLVLELGFIIENWLG